MNYEPVTAGNQTNKNAGIKDNVNAVVYIKPTNEGEINGQEKEGGASNKEGDQNVQDFRAELDNLLVQQKEGYANSTKKDSTISLSVSTAGQSFTNVGDLPTDSLMPDLEDIADLLNTEFIRIINVQFIRDINSATQTRRMTKISEEHAMVIQALTDPSWIEAMQEELLQCKLQKVWTLVDLPKGKRAIGTNWCAQGYTQEEGIDYDKVFAPVARIEAIRLFLAYASFMGFIVYQMDVKSAFLYGTIEEELYVCQPPGFEDLQFLDKVYKGRKKVYMVYSRLLKPGNETLSPHLLEMDLEEGSLIRLCLSRRTKAASTPIESNKALNKDEEAKDVDVHLYRSMIGSLMYLTASRPDIMFVVCACARDSPFDLEAFSDSDYAGASLDRKSTTGGCQFLGKRLISWQCKKQTIVANSTTEAEYVAAANCCGQHIEISHHFIRDSYEKKLIQVIKIHTDHNVTDLLTKAFDVSSDEFGVKTGSCKVNAARQDLVLLGEIEGKGSGQPSEPQPPSSTAPPSQVTTVATHHQKTHKPRRAKRGQETEIPQSSGPPNKVSTSGSGEDSIEYQVDLTDFVPPTPYDSPLSVGHTPGSDEGRPNFKELINLYTQLSNRVLALENSKTAQDLVIQKLKKRVKRLEKALRARTPGMKLFKIGTSRRKGLDKENVSKQGRKSDKTKPMFNDSDFDVLDDAMENVKGGSIAEQITTARDTLNTDSINVSTVGPLHVSTVGPSNVSTAGPSAGTAGDIFEDEMITIADTLVPIRSARSRTISVIISNVEEEPRRETPVPIVQS
ncbi:retrovirus-related pol polyprotein from transposon TNT 1-94 [Tanacetum coccineum]|uniref:Retrovirus-related pol polyprotein from transposon TNT 1-94 n=1 Tax=Tanacetum coccineum TaxID=301880 RepID=A0ABQ4XQM9_9ASTR